MPLRVGMPKAFTASAHAWGLITGPGIREVAGMKCQRLSPLSGGRAGTPAGCSFQRVRHGHEPPVHDWMRIVRDGGTTASCPGVLLPIS